MNTLLLHSNRSEDLCKAAEILSKGKLVALPTETVYGLAADMSNEKAVKNIFLVKNRSFSNPLTVHISRFSQIRMLSNNFCSKAKKLIERFWPGPLTVVVKKTEAVPNYITNGDDYVGIRFPSNETFKKVTNLLNNPVVATSANVSRNLSPTRFEHVYNEMYGKIDAILKDEESSILGLESTIVSFKENVPEILRLGATSCEEIESTIGTVKLKVENKHINYKSKIVAVDSNSKKFFDYLKTQEKLDIAVLCFAEDTYFCPKEIQPFVLGSVSKPEEIAANFYDVLRKLERANRGTVYVHLPIKKGLNFSIYNKILQLANFNILKL